MNRRTWLFVAVGSILGAAVGLLKDLLEERAEK
jgi:hypothetical protein